MPDERDERALQLWVHLSTKVHATRCHGVPEAMTATLDEVVENDRDGLVAPAYALWAGDNQALAWDFREAARRFHSVRERYADRVVVGDSVATIATERRSDSLHQLGDIDGAIDERVRLADEHPEHRPRAESLERAGEFAETSNRFDQAAELYRAAASENDHRTSGSVYAAHLAQCNLERLRSGREWMRPDGDSLLAELADALREGSGGRLRSLLSRTHACIGASAGEREFVVADELAAVIVDEVQGAEVRVLPAAADRSGHRLLLETRGWDGALLKGTVHFVVDQTPHGFEWVGVAMTEDPNSGEGRALRARMRKDDIDPPPADEPPSDPAPAPSPVPIEQTVAGLGLKCPWPAGGDLRAGGIIPFALQNAAIIYAASVTGPFFWLTLAAGYLIAASASPCGFGPGGLYFGQAPTHTADETYAVDFARFTRGIPFALTTRGVPVLAITTGVVGSVRSSIVTGDTSGPGNQTLVRHMRRDEIVASIIVALFGGTAIPFHYTACYLHLMGPGMMPVSPGMFVEQGARLGFMDHTGRSIADHLHFSLHDDRVPYTGTAPPFFPGIGMSVPPSPMDGQSLLSGDDGACMHSTNVPVP